MNSYIVKRSWFLLILLLNVPWSAACFAAPGDLDPTFSGDGKLRVDLGIGSAATAVAIAQDGKILVAGDRNNGGGALIRLNLDGTLDNSFANNGIRLSGYGGIVGMALQSDGRIIVVGTRNILGVKEIFVTRFNDNGDQVPNFGPNGNGTYTFLDFGGMGSEASGVAIQADNKIVVTGTQLAFFETKHNY